MPEGMDIYSLIAEGEHQRQDFKFEISSASKIARSLSAFANTDGGRLLIGVKDNGKIAGVQSDEEMFMVEAAGSLFCNPAVSCDMKSLRVEGKVVVIAWISPASELPVRAKLEDGRYCAFVRVADENIVASPVQMELWRADRNGRGALISFGKEEQQLLRILEKQEGITLSQFIRQAKLPRRRAIQLLADYIRFGLAQQVFVEHAFRYKTL